MIAPVVISALLLLTGVIAAMGVSWRRYALQHVPIPHADDGPTCTPRVKR